MTQSFPDNFLIGTAHSPHQVEGGNVNSDWWWWEHLPGTPCRESSGDACDFYHRYAEDVGLMAELGLQAFRFGIEWARIEPAPGEFSRAQLAHYRRILETCHDHKIVTVVTFHHFTLPRWLQEAGGFTAPDFARLFERYSSQAADSLGDLIDYACTINEPESLGEGGYLIGVNPPGRKNDVDGMWKVAENVLEAHLRGASAIKSRSRAAVGVTLALPDLQYEDGATPGNAPLELNRQVSERFFEAARSDDFIGVQTYTRNRFGPEGPRGPHVQWGLGRDPEERENTTQLGQEYYPQALGATIRLAWAATEGTPVFVTESGIATAFDEKRIRFIRTALREVLSCLRDGIDVRGYLYWSLVDNFEWSLGYRPTFGLASVDRVSFERRRKPSAGWLGSVARSRGLPPD